MPDRRGKESPREQYRRLAQACLEMVPSVQEGEGRVALIEMARVWMRLAESYPEEKPISPAGTEESRPLSEQQKEGPPEKGDDKE